MRHQHVIARLFNKPHWVEPHYAQVLVSGLSARLGVQPMLDAGDGADITPRPAREPIMLESGILVLPIVGSLMHRGDFMDAWSGSQSYTNISNMLLLGLKDPEVRGILLDVDSPGGQAGGCLELADTILDARSQKPIWAIANSDACSAAYAIGASAERFYATLSGEVGSIGVVLLHMDVSKALSGAGVKPTLIFAGSHKVDGNPYEALPKDVRADFQRGVDESYDLFVKTVAARRPLTEEQVRETQARVYSAQEAADLKLIDGVMSFAAVVAAMEESLTRPVFLRQSQPSKEQSDMSTKATDNKPADPTVPAHISPEAHQAALAAARQEGHTAGYALGRTDAAAIFTSDAAKGREQFAAKLAADATFAKDKAIDLLGSAPKAEAAKSGVLSELMKGNDPKVGVEDPADKDAKAARKAELAVIGKSARAIGR